MGHVTEHGRALTLEDPVTEISPAIRHLLLHDWADERIKALERDIVIDYPEIGIGDDPTVVGWQASGFPLKEGQGAFLARVEYRAYLIKSAREHLDD